MKKIVVVSGGFDPLHSGHISYFNSSKSFGDYLIVALNSDDWLINKKGKSFMPINERRIIIENLSVVDEVIDFKDDSYGSCSLGLEKIKQLYPKSEIIFCNGGDRNNKNIPEMKVKGIRFEFGVGGVDKKNSSSWILKDFKYDSEDRVWGKFYNLFVDKNIKLKELIIDSKKGMSLQRHYKRDEVWFVSKGKCAVNHSNTSHHNIEEIILSKEDVFHVKRKHWHQIFNPFDEPCHIIEIQYGEMTSEEDIERKRYYNEDTSNK